MNYKPTKTDPVTEEPVLKRNRLSLTPEAPDKNSSEHNLNNTDQDFLQDSFTMFEDTQALIDTSNKPCANKSFSSFTQMCSDTQIMKKIDDDINNSNKVIKTDCNTSSSCQQLDNSFLQTSFDLYVPKSTNEDKTVSDTKVQVSESFSTLQCKRDIEMLFKKVEHSICEPGPDQDKTLAKNDDNFEDIHTAFAENICSAINWDEESWFSNVISSQDQTEKFGSVIKNALLKNAEKSVVPGKIVNLTLAPTQVVFQELGDFYGLPKKVKDLFKLYRGIDNLYGE